MKPEDNNALYSLVKKPCVPETLLAMNNNHCSAISINGTGKVCRKQCYSSA